MSDFLVKFSTQLAGADQEARAPRVWNTLLPLLGNWYADGARFAAALWLADDDEGLRHTLWLASNSVELGRTPQPYCVTATATSRTSEGLAAAFEAVRRNWVSPRFDISDGAVVAIPLQHFVQTSASSSAPRVVGAVSLFGAFDRGLIEKKHNELTIAANIAGSWLHLNREARIAKALSDLQEKRQSFGTTRELAELTGGILRDHSSANLMWQVLVPDGARLKALASWSAEAMEVHNRNPADDQSPASRFHFERMPALDQDQAVLRFDGEGAVIDAPEAWAGATFATLTGLRPNGVVMTALLQRVRDRMSTKSGSKPPVIATLLLVCGPDDRFVGGRFSRTNLRILEHVQDYFRNSYALLLQREKMNKINDLIVQSAPDMMDDATDLVNLRVFAELTRDILPSVTEAVITELRLSPRRESYYRSDDVSGTRPPWFSKPVDPDKITPNPARAGRYILRKSIKKGDGDAKSYDLVMELSSPNLSIVEETLLERITAEILATMNLHLDQAKWAIQLAEVRHNLRSVVQSLLGKAAQVVTGFEVVKHQPPDIVYDRLIRRASYHKSVAQLRYGATELLALTENIRTMSGAGNRIVLQISSVDIREMIAECLTLFDSEIERRSIACNFSDQLPNNLRRVDGDRAWLHIMLFNLIENAIKYSRKRGRVDIRLWPQGLFWRLEAANEGKPIPENMLEKIFEPYVRVDPEPGEQPMPGTGIGLASIKRIADLHQVEGVAPPGGAPVLVTSKLIASPKLQPVPNARTVFTISIPRKLGGS